VNPRIAKLWRNPAVAAIRSVLDRNIIETASALFGAQAVNYVLPLLLIPYLARVLGPETWGVVMFIQAIGVYLLMVIEYSFELSATRQVARNRNDPETLAAIVSSVLGARLVLVAVCVSIIALAQFLIPMLAELGGLLWLGAFWFMATAMRPFWFFLGLERVRTVTIVEISLRVLAVAGVILLVNSPAEAWLIFALQGGASAIAMLITTAMMYRRVTPIAPSLSSTIEALRQGWRLFLFRASTSIYDMSNTLILGFLAGPVAVAYYGAADRFTKVLVNSLFPVTFAMFPRASTLIRSDAPSAARMARITITSMFTVTSVGSIVLFLLAPLLVRVVVGPGYEESATVLRILLLALVINSIIIPLGQQWLIPSGLDGFLTKVTVAGSIVHVPLAIVLSSQYQHIGAATALVITLTFNLVLLMGLSLVRGTGPFRFQRHDLSIDAKATSIGARS
jgi:polysaccharide transporter, PST family